MKFLTPKFFIKTLLISTLCLFFCAYQAALPDPKAQVALQYQADLEQFYLETAKLKKICNQNVPSDVNPIRKQYLSCRKAFKTIETLFEYYNSIYTKNFINGAPLPKLNDGVDEILELEPHGLQVIDELMYADTLANSMSEIKKELSDLEKYASEMSKGNLIQIQDRAVFEACRQGLVRVATLGITGFDTPGSINGITDASSVFISLQKTVQPYLLNISQKSPALKKRISTALQLGIKYLSDHNDFDAFDRVYFTKKFINPLYGDLLEAQLALGIETWEEASSNKKSINYSAKNIFAKDFLNPNYYMQLPKERNNSKVIALGKMLFFDPVLSNNNQRACASCHSPQKAFTDGQAKSVATDYKGTVLRNAPTLINSVYADKFFYDLRADVLEDQIEHVIVSEKEFHSNYIEIFDRVGKSDAYMKLFAEAFPETKATPINKYSISASLAAYVGTLTALNAPFDKYMRGEQKELSPSAIKGYNLFAGKAGCASCHFAPIFNGTVPPLYQESESEVLGVPEGKEKSNARLDSDLGRGTAKIMEQSPIYNHSFKTPTLRNIAMTAPYMHNGVYETLEEVMEFYNNGGGEGLGLQTPNQTLPADKLNLTKTEITDIINFMKSLTDTVGTTAIPKTLPYFPENSGLNRRKIGGDY